MGGQVGRYQEKRNLGIAILDTVSYGIQEVFDRGNLVGAEWANTEPSMHFMETDTDPLMHFRKANTDPSMYFRRAITIFFTPSFTPNLTHHFTSKFTPVFTPSFNPTITTWYTTINTM